MRIPHRIGQLHLFAVLKEPRAVFHDVGVQGIRHMVARLGPVVGDLLRPIDGDQQWVEVEVVQMCRPARHLAQQIRPPDNLIHRARANRRQNLPHFLGVEGDQVHHLVRRPGKLRPQSLVLRGDADRAGVRLALPHHDAAHRDQRGGADAIFLGPHHRRHHDVAPGPKAAIGPQRHPFAQVVHRQNLMRLGQAHFPRHAGIFDRCPRAGPGPAVMPRNQDHIGLGLDHTRRNGADAGRGHQFHRHLGARVDLLEIIDQLRQVFDRIDVMMRRRADQADPRRRMAQPRNQSRHLHPRQLAAFTGLGPLGDLDLQFLTGVQVFRRDAKAPRCHLLDLG